MYDPSRTNPALLHSVIHRVTDILGEGQFGTVRKGIWRNASGPSTIVEVAVKTLKAGSEERDKVKFLQEATIMAQFKHGNVVTMHGVVTTTGIVSWTSIVLYMV